MRRSTQILVATLLAVGLGCSAITVPPPKPEVLSPPQTTPAVVPMPKHGVYPRPLQKEHVAAVTWMVTEFPSKKQQKMIFMTHGQGGHEYWVKGEVNPQNLVVYSITEEVRVSGLFPNVLHHQFYVVHPPKNEYLTKIVVSVEDLNDDGDTVKLEIYEVTADADGWFHLDLDDLPDPDPELKKELTAQYD